MTSHAPVRTRSRVLYSRRGVSLVETMIAIAIMSLLLTAVVAGLRMVATGASEQVVETGMGYNARLSMDEMLAQIRYGRKVVASCSVGGETYTTSGSTIVVEASGYDPATTALVLPGVTDYMIIKYDATTKEIRETLYPGAGSKRVARTRYRLAQNVDSFTLTYRVRDQFVQPVSGDTHQLNAVPLKAPLVTVNGVVGAGAWNAGSPKTIRVTAEPGDDIHIIYEVSASDTTALEFVQQVDAAVGLANTSPSGRSRSLTMLGSVCLRNLRK